MVTARDLKDPQGNILVTLEHRYEHNSYRIEISHYAMAQLRRGDVFVLSAGHDGVPRLSVEQRS